MVANSRLLLSRKNKRWVLECWHGENRYRLQIQKDNEQVKFLESGLNEFLYKAFDVDPKIELKEIKEESIINNNLWPGELPEQNKIWLMAEIEKDKIKITDYKNEIYASDSFYREYVVEIAHNVRVKIEEIVNSPVKDARQVEMFEPILFGDKNDC